jgi:3-(3-hydroxy-phenyl)propionate hydroxylase
MRPAGRGPLESLYFNYPLFEAPRAAELEGLGPRHKVAIVGAGPIGMTAALTLASHGVACVLLDQKETFNDGSRATCISRSSMQIFDQIGVAQPFLEKALGWRFGSSFYQGKLVYRLEMPHSPNDKFLPMYNLQQQYVEQFLHDAVAKCQLIDMRWSSEVRSVTTPTDGATLSVTTPRGDYTLLSDYVLAADGARSPMRSFMGLRLQGDNYEGKYVIADVRMAHDFPTERRAFFDPVSNPGGTILIHKQPGDIWRIDYQLQDGEPEDEAILEATIRARVGAIISEIGHLGDWDLEWWSIYSANTLCLDEYKHGRVIFIGDSAHIVPIFGVRGLNNGLADAHNIGWKLAYVLNGIADEALLDSYSPERRGATLDVFANASKSTRFMTPPTRGWTLMRDAALSLSVDNEFARPFANPRQMTPYTYGDSPLTLASTAGDQFLGGPVVGAACPNVALPGGGHLFDKLDRGFVAIAFHDGTADTEVEATLTVLAKLDPNLTAVRIGLDGALADQDGTIARAFCAVPGTLYLLRPDLYVAGRWRSINADEIVGSMQRCLGGH